MFNSASFENSRPDGFAVLEVAGDEREGRRFVPLKRSELKGDVGGPLAALRLTQAFGYSKEQCDKVLEAAYRFPLPGDAAVTGVVVRYGDAEIKAELKERAQAEAAYVEARREGRQAALATRESPDVFTLLVAGIKPDQEVIVETSYVQLARAEGAGWSLRIPLTTAPRYVRSDEAESRHAQGQPLALLRDPGHRFRLDVTFSSAGAVNSKTHKLDTTVDGEGTRVQLADGEIIPDRDCILFWSPAMEEQQAALRVFLHKDEVSGYLYFLATVAPPAIREQRPSCTREVILLVDHSGSMEGAKWAASDWAVKTFLFGMTESDRFDLGLFHNTTRWLSKTTCPADEKTVDEGIKFLEQHRDSGGTELGVALEQALGIGRAPGDPSRHVLIITDAEVTDAGRILRLAGEESKRTDRRRISILCIDAAPNSFLALELAGRGGGVARFLTSDPAQEDIATALDEVLMDWAQPVLPNLRLEVNCPGVEQSSGPGRDRRSSKGSVLDLGDLPAGRSIWVTGRIRPGDRNDLTFSLKASGDWDVASSALTSDRDQSPGQPAIKSLFGARRILALEHLIHSGYQGQQLTNELERLGYDPEEVLSGDAGASPKVYAENIRAGVNEQLKRLLVREALDYGIACSETAFIATRSEAGKVIDGTVIVANALPAGWSDSFVSVRAFAAGPPTAAPGTPMMAVKPMVINASGLAKSAGGIFGRIGAAGKRRQTAEHKTEPRQTERPPLFSGVPVFHNTEAILFDSTVKPGAAVVPDAAQIKLLTVKVAGKPTALDPGLVISIFVGDMSSPAARVRLTDIVRQGGSRPLNVAKPAGAAIRIVLEDPAGAWSAGAPHIELSLDW